MPKLCDCDHCEICPVCFPAGFDAEGNRIKTDEKTPAPKLVAIDDHHKEQAAIVLSEALDEEPDTVIVLCFWKSKGQYKIKVSAIPDRLTLIGALEEAKNKVITDGYVE
jgi:hypothetical protein